MTTKIGRRLIVWENPILHLNPADPKNFGKMDKPVRVVYDPDEFDYWRVHPNSGILEIGINIEIPRLAMELAAQPNLSGRMRIEKKPLWMIDKWGWAKVEEEQFEYDLPERSVAENIAEMTGTVSPPLTEVQEVEIPLPVKEVPNDPDEVIEYGGPTRLVPDVGLMTDMHPDGLTLTEATNRNAATQVFAKVTDEGDLSGRQRFDDRVMQRAEDMRNTAEMARIKGGGDGKPSVVPLDVTSILPAVASDETIASGVTAAQIREAAKSFTYIPPIKSNTKKNSG